MNLLTPLLYPFAVLFDAVTSVRNRLYDTGVKPAVSFDLPVISVGNLSVGGTGKTPMVEYLIRLLSSKTAIATLSRGYGRKTRGIRIAGPADNPSTLGDEPFQFYRKFGKSVVVAVGEERVLAIPRILHEHPDTGVVVLDDAFQHRRIKPSFQILLTDFNRPFAGDYLLPAGRLRESRRGAGRADVVVVTKCPASISEEAMIGIESRIRRYTDKAVFFAKIAYGELLPVTGASPYRPEAVVLVTGIANPDPLEQYCRRHYRLVRHLRFADHHAYTRKDFEMICEAASREGAVVVTTEKDMVKIDTTVFTEASVALYYVPIQIEFLKNGKEFDELVLNAARSHAP